MQCLVFFCDQLYTIDRPALGFAIEYIAFSVNDIDVRLVFKIIFNLQFLLIEHG